jgi:hypothetical protein
MYQILFGFGFADLPRATAKTHFSYGKIFLRKIFSMAKKWHLHRIWWSENRQAPYLVVHDEGSGRVRGRENGAG